MKRMIKPFLSWRAMLLLVELNGSSLRDYFYRSSIYEDSDYILNLFWIFYVD